MGTILVIGGAGYIGSQLIRDLPKEFPGQTIRILDNMVRERYVSLWDLPNGCKFEFIEGDTTKDEDVKKALKDVDIIFDLGGITNAPKSFERKELTMEVNVAGVGNLLEHATKSDVKRYVYASSASIYGPTKDIAKEDHLCKPVSPYGESKLLAEKELLNAVENNGLKASIIRFGTVFGWSVGIRFDTVINRFAFNASIKKPIEVWKVNKGEKRPYIHVKDASRALVFMSKKNINGIFNAASENIILEEVVNVITRLVPDVVVNEVSKENLNQLSYMIDSSKIKGLGFEFKYDLQGGVKEMIDKFNGFR